MAMNPEAHNLGELIVGAEYGMDAAMYWAEATRARGEFVRACQGKRLGYAESRGNWTAAAVYRHEDGRVLGFVGEAERQSRPTTFQFVARDRDVFYDGHGPQRVFTVETTGGPGYQTTLHRNAERVVDITWGEDVQPAISGLYTVVNRGTQKVMEVANAGTANGTTVQGPGQHA